MGPTELKPIPQNPLLGGLAQLLEQAKIYGNKVNLPSWVPLLGGMGAGDLVLGEAPSEIENLSYGNMPLRINPNAGETASYVPEIKPGRKQGVADLLSVAGPRGTAVLTGGMADPALAKAMLIPGGKVSLYAAHNARTPRIVGTKAQLPYDTMNLSTGITRNGIIDEFASGADAMWLIPNLERIGPESGTAALLNRDTFSIRGASMPAKRGHEIGYWLSQYPSGDKLALLADQARARNTSRFADVAPRGAIKSEGHTPWGVAHSGPYRFHGPSRSIPRSVHDLLLHESPRFQTIKSFENSPRGAGLLADYKDPNFEGATQLTSDWLDEATSFARRNINPDLNPGDVKELLGLIRGLAGTPSGSEIFRRPRVSPHNERLFSFDDAAADKLRPWLAQKRELLYNKSLSSGFAGLPMKDLLRYGVNPEEAIAGAKDLVEAFKTIPSSYAEHKNFGPIGLNPWNFRGIITGSDNPYIDSLKRAAADRGLPLEIFRGQYTDQNQLLSAYERLWDKTANRSRLQIGMAEPVRTTVGNAPEVTPTGTMAKINKFDLDLFKQYTKDLNAMIKTGNPTKIKENLEYFETISADVLDQVKKHGTPEEVGAMQEFITKMVAKANTNTVKSPTLTHPTTDWLEYADYIPDYKFDDLANSLDKYYLEGYITQEQFAGMQGQLKKIEDIYHSPGWTNNDKTLWWEHAQLFHDFKKMLGYNDANFPNGVNVLSPKP